MQATLLRHEESGTLTDPDYIAASRVVYDPHVCRVVPWPDEVARTFAIMDEDNTVYRSMNGPTEFHVIGTMKDWAIEDRLHHIAAPTLLISGRFDEATPLVVRPYVENIPGCRWMVFKQSNHMPHIEDVTRSAHILIRQFSWIPVSDQGHRSCLPKRVDCLPLSPDKQL